jgi:hypothetical protein
MSKLILQPAGDDAPAPNLARGRPFRGGFSLARVRPFISDDLAVQLEALYGNEPIHAWGVKPGATGATRKQWQKVEPGDITLFFRYKRVFAMATVVAKTENAALARKLWPWPGNDTPGASSWECISFLQDIVAVDLPAKQVLKLLGEDGDHVQGYRVVGEERSDGLLLYLYQREEAQPRQVSRARYERSLRGALRVPVGSDRQSLDIRRVVASRLEQAYLRYHLFRHKSVAECGMCGMCGKSYPVELLVAAHIKRREVCTLEECLDVEHIVMPMCRFGCDELFERGYIAVDSSGHIRIRPNARSSVALNAYLDDIVGRLCSYWSSTTEPYFAWHRDYHTVKPD